MMRIFLDTNIMLDMLLRREPFVKEATQLFTMADRGKIKLFVSGQSIATTHYILCKSIKVEQARNALQKLLLLVKVIDVNHKGTLLALSDLNFSDVEDSMQYQCALKAKASVLITRNEQDFRKASLSVMTPAQFLGQF